MSGWTQEQLAQLRAEAEHKQAMRDAGIDPANPVEREAWEAEHGAPPSDAWAGERGETTYGQHMRMGWALDQLELAEHLCPLTACVYCGLVGLVEHFELVNHGNSYACKQANLCALRTEFHTLTEDGGTPAGVVLQLVRELAQVARDDRAARDHLGRPGSPQGLAHGAVVRPKRMLSTQELARLHVVLAAASEWLSDAAWGDWGQALAQARADLGCRRCGAMGPREPCHTDGGGDAREWHQGRKF